jgi:DNA-binding PadR family transcriptional regulator
VDSKRRKNFRITKKGRKLLEEARQKLIELSSEVIEDRDARAERGRTLPGAIE